MTYSGQLPALPGKQFLAELRNALAGFSQIATAEFQVTRIDDQLRTRVRYELVGSGQGFHREQRVGVWDLGWQTAATNEYRVRRWIAHGETRSRCTVSETTDVAGQAFGGNHWWSGQLLHGVDYWRTVLDGACGIDIYGHNGVSVGDIDDDGFDDLYICQPAGLPNRLYRNRGDGTFDRHHRSIRPWASWKTPPARMFADFDNDGRQDLIVVRANGPLLFLIRAAVNSGRSPTLFNSPIRHREPSPARPPPTMIATADSTSTSPLRLLPGHGPIQVSSPLLRR